MEMRTKLGWKLVINWSWVKYGHKLAIYWAKHGFGQKLVKIWGTLIREEHRNRLGITSGKIEEKHARTNSAAVLSSIFEIFPL